MFYKTFLNNFKLLFTLHFMNKVPNEYISKKIKSGDEKLFNQLFDDYYTSLCFFANNYLKDLDLSRSLVQEVFVNLWVKREKLDIGHSVKSYLYNSVKNISIDYIRKEKKKIHIIDFSDDIVQSPFKDLVEEAELNDRINQSINELPEKCKEIFKLCRFEGLKYSQIAEQLNISIKTVEMQMGIALKKIRQKLSDNQMLNLLSFVFLKKTRDQLQGIGVHFRLMYVRKDEDGQSQKY